LTGDAVAVLRPLDHNRIDGPGRHLDALDLTGIRIGGPTFGVGGGGDANVVLAIRAVVHTSSAAAVCDMARTAAGAITTLRLSVERSTLGLPANRRRLDDGFLSFVDLVS
jgi:hypothetical protein